MSEVRATVDVDVLGQARPRQLLHDLDAALRRAGFEIVLADFDGYAHRYVRDDVIVDLLAPDGLNPPATLDGKTKAIGVPGGSQAPARAVPVNVRIGAESFEVRCPTLIGAILIKARPVLVHNDPEAQRADVLRLLSLLDDPRAASAEISASERSWIRRAEPDLRFDDPTNLPEADMRRARLAARLLTAPP